ncbi:MAG: hypothetical protein ACO3JL_16975, partial [Myxococcota bacterium]
MARRISVLTTMIFSLLACPEALPTTEEWQSVAATPEADSSAELALRQRAQKTAAAIRVKRMQAVFVSEDEERCVNDDDCVLTPFHCCGCSGGGQQAAIHKDRLPSLLQRRILYCAD